ncbi:GNAT family N-acetyltransferase [Salaquimonas pukyongi]|uniref:GNAT family N-acetyltransferase n=1 Tax=Salaquimonas pukyongi TaxID=2712698 RepID=UPI00096B947D|nr:GNAT family protein [Salaquimonas pukyongi]
MAEDMSGWTPRERPKRVVLEGRYVRLEPLDASRHGHQLFEASCVEDAEDRFRWLYETPPGDITSFLKWVETVSASEDPLFFAVIDKKSGRVGGRQTLMRIDAQNGVIEIGNIYWGPVIARTRIATEALYLFMRHAFKELGYRRFEWKCNNDNEPSKRAALRFGFQFEGIFRQHLIVKGLNRDTAWFSIIDKEWPQLERAYEGWLDPENFEPDGRQRRRLEEFRDLESAGQ